MAGILLIPQPCLATDDSLGVHSRADATVVRQGQPPFENPPHFKIMAKKQAPHAGADLGERQADSSRRSFIKSLSSLAVAAAAPTSAQAAWGGLTFGDAFADFFQQHYQRMTAEEIQETLQRIERKAHRRYGVDIQCKNTPPQEGVVFGYAINITKCKGYRDCVSACTRENNLSRDIQYIRVLELDEGSLNLEQADHYYDHDGVPAPGKYYLPVQCMQCDDPPCVKACPIEATWMEPDGVVVVDYDWCFGCRYCMVACPYQARHFNWDKPKLPPERL
ncbi:MAG: 4Fe-4S dicluster domain-containing protein [Gammaproteobacteria bacterium]